MEQQDQISAPDETQPLSPPSEETAAPSQGALRAEIESLKKQIQFRRQSYEEEEGRFERLRWERISKGRRKARAGKLKEIEEKLIELIAEQQKIYQEETALLGAKKQMVQKFLDELPHDVFTRELNTEREAIESRESELRRRDSALGEELKKFQLQGAPQAPRAQ